MNLVIKSFILSLLAVSNVNAASIRGTRSIPQDETEGVTYNVFTSQGCISGTGLHTSLMEDTTASWLLPEP